ncbi:phospholipase-like protein [Tanacetum coccineum]
MLRKQHKVDASHYDMPLIYYTEGHSLHFGRSEFALITGLPFGHVNFGLYTSRELKFRNRVFPQKLGLSVTKLDVIGVIEDEETFQKLCDQDSIRLCLILCLEVIFMGRLLTCPVDDTLFRLNVIEKHSDDHYFGMKRDRMYVPMYTFSGFVFAFQVWIFKSFERCNCWWNKDPNVIPRGVGWSKKSIFNRSDCGYLFAKESTTTSDIRPTKAEYESSWWIRSQLFFRQHVPKAPVVQHHSLYETYLAKLEKSRKRGHSSSCTRKKERIWGIVSEWRSFDESQCAAEGWEDGSENFRTSTLKLTYGPVENHKSEYFCEVCEEKLNPNEWFYHCHECAYSLHTRCAPVILNFEATVRSPRSVYWYLNIKFGGTYNIKGHEHSVSLAIGSDTDGECLICHGGMRDDLIFGGTYNIKGHEHSVSLAVGSDDDGRCEFVICHYSMRDELIVKCLKCKFAMHWECGLRL